MADRKLFAVYVELRRRVYFAEYPGLPDNFGFEDETDRVSDIVVYVVDDIVEGGARLTVSGPSCPRSLPLEEKGFSLRDYTPLKEFKLHCNPYGEISRMGADPEAMDGFRVSFGLGDSLCKRAANLGLDVIFSICPKKPARLNEINAKRRGVPFRNFGSIPTPFDVPMFLCAFSGLLNIYGHREREAA